MNINAETQDAKELKGIPRFLYILLLATIISALFAIISRLGLPYLSYLFVKLPVTVIVILALLTLFSFVNSFGTLPYTFKGMGLPGPSEIIQMIFSLVAILLFLMVIPALIIYMISSPVNIKKAIKIGIFLSSSLLSTVYYLSHKKGFRSPADVVGFFAGACIGPVAIIEIFL